MSKTKKRAGGYRIANRIKQKLIEIDRKATIGHDTVLVSDGLNERERILLMNNYKSIKKLIKQILEMG